MAQILSEKYAFRSEKSRQITSEKFGPLSIRQYKKGYRFSLDPFLLAHHTKINPGERLLDLGCGSGIIPLLLCLKNPESTFFAVEIQDKLAILAKQNIYLNKFKEKIRLIKGDMKSLNQKDFNGPLDLITINPPYYPANTGRINPDNQKAAARHEIYIKLEEWILVARRLLKTRGRLKLIFPAERSSELIYKLIENQLEPKAIRYVHSTLESQATLLIVKAVLNAGPGLKLLPPLVIYKDKDIYSEEAKKILYPF